MHKIDGIIVIVGKLLVIMSWMPTYMMLNCFGRLNKMPNARIEGVAFSLFSFCILLLLLLTKWNLFLTVFSICISNARGMRKISVSLSSLSQVIHSGGKDVTNFLFSLSFLSYLSFLLVRPSFMKKPENTIEEL